VGVLGGALRRYFEHGLYDWAAALTYYAILSLFPAMLVLVALLGVFGQYPQTTDLLLQIARPIAPASVLDVFRKAIERVVLGGRGAHGTLLVAGLIGALWSASGFVGAFMRASNLLYEARPRGFLLQRSLQVAITVAMVVVVAAVAGAVVLTGPIAEGLGNRLGIGDATVLLWDVVKWPFLLAATVVVISMLNRVAPNVRQSGRRRWITAGGVFTVLIGIAASLGFGFYVTHLGSFDRTYGSLGAVIAFLVWLFIINNALLLGALIDAEVRKAEEADGVEILRLRLPERSVPGDRARSEA
jgi:membrane protein